MPIGSPGQSPSVPAPSPAPVSTGTALSHREHKVLVMRGKSIRAIRRGGMAADDADPEDDFRDHGDDASRIGRVGGRPITVAEALTGRGHVGDLS